MTVSNSQIYVEIKFWEVTQKAASGRSKKHRDSDSRQYGYGEKYSSLSWVSCRREYGEKYSSVTGKIRASSIGNFARLIVKFAGLIFLVLFGRLIVNYNSGFIREEAFNYRADMQL